jgi:hypothetical protein
LRGVGAPRFAAFILATLLQPNRRQLEPFHGRQSNASEDCALSENGGVQMTKISTPAQAAEKERLNSLREKRLINKTARME